MNALKSACDNNQRKKQELERIIKDVSNEYKTLDKEIQNYDLEQVFRFLCLALLLFLRFSS